MIPASFEYEVAESVEDALELLSDGGEDASVLAGGHSLLPLMRLRLARPALLVDIGRIDELSYVRGEGDTIAIGALTRHHEVASSPLLRGECALLARTAEQIGDPQVRHRGTIGGAIAHADPASDLPAALLALEAELVIAGPDGERAVPAGEFFLAPFTSALGPGALLTEIRVPRLERTGSAYVKFNRRAQDWAIVGVAALVEAADGEIRRASIGLTNMDGTPVRARAVEEALAGAPAEADAIARAASRAAEGTSPPDDSFASAEYRSHLATVLVRRAVEAALA